MHVPLLRRASLLVALCGAAAALPAHAQTWSLQRLGPVIVTALSADGRAAAGNMPDTWETFRWTARSGVTRLGRGTMVPLGHRSGIPSISSDGSVVSATILSDDGTYSTAGRWSVAGGWTMLAPVPADGGLFDGEDASSFGMSPDGRVVTGLYWRPGQPGGTAHAMAWSAATGMLDLGSSGNSSRVDAASADGSVLVGWDEHPSFGNRRAAVWVGGVRTVLEDSDWPSEASAVNTAGTVIVGQTADANNNFQMSATMWIWNGAGWNKSILGVMDKRGKKNGTAYPEAVSDDGSIVVGTARLDASSPQSVGFIWTASTGMQQAPDWLAAQGLNLGPLSKLIDVTAVTGNGKVMAAVTQDVIAPYTMRSVLIKRQDAGQ